MGIIPFRGFAIVGVFNNINPFPDGKYTLHQLKFKISLLVKTPTKAKEKENKK